MRDGEQLWHDVIAGRVSSAEYERSAVDFEILPECKEESAEQMKAIFDDREYSAEAKKSLLRAIVEIEIGCNN